MPGFASPEVPVSEETAREAAPPAREARRARWAAVVLRAHWPLLVALAFAGAIGFWRISERGSVFIDEGYQHLEGQWVKGKFTYLLKHFPGSFDERAFVLNDAGGLPLSYGKPLHALLNALAIRLLPGDGPTPGLVLQGLFGLGTIVLVYAIASRLAGRVAGVASAALLSSSATFLAYRRSGLPEMDSAFFFALAVWALVAWSSRPLTRRRALTVGVLTGLCFTSNDRWYVALPVILGMAAILDPRHEPWRRRLRSVASTVLAVFGGFLLPIVVFEVASAAFLWMAHDQRVALPYETYFQQLYRRYLTVTVGHRATPALSQIPRSPYLGYLRDFEGAAWLAVAAVAGVFAIARMRRSLAVALLWAGGPILLASASRLAGPRYVSLGIPGIALLLGLAAAAAWGSRRRFAAGLAASALCIAVFSSMANVPTVFRIRGGWNAVLVAIAKGGGGRIVSPKGYSLATYVGLSGVVLGYEESLAWARKRRDAGARWLVLEVWVPPGTRLQDARPPAAFTVLGPTGELSSFFLRSGRPVALSRFPPHDFVYEGFPPHLDRLVILYDLRDLPPA